jgi:mitogen-activated protein kinase 1/3
LKICDFGLARGLMPDTNADLTEYVVTRWYRAPEIMLSCQEYTCSIDVWSAGCVFAEMLGRQPLFRGNDFIHQLTLIMQTLGRPDDLSFVTNEKAREFLEQQEPREVTPLSQLFPNADPDGLNLLTKMLVFNPEDRITVDQALEHPYFECIRELEDERECAPLFDFSFENGTLKRPQIRRLIFEDCCEFHPECREQG